MNSYHYDSSRQMRDDFIEKMIGGGTVVDSFMVDKGHPKGAEIHSVTDTGIILIYNSITNKLITKLIARPEQIRKLYRAEGREPPSRLIKIARKHNIHKYNEV